MDNSLKTFLATEKCKKFLEYFESYKPENFFVIQDSELARKSIERRYKGRFSVFSCEIQKSEYSFFCSIDQTLEKYSAKDIVKKTTKPLIITGLGLYGEMFIKEIRMFEKVDNTQDKGRIPIVIYGSPKEEKIEKLQNLIDLYINNLDVDAFLKLDIVFSGFVK